VAVAGTAVGVGVEGTDVAVAVAGMVVGVAVGVEVAPSVTTDQFTIPSTNPSFKT
jgi:hypothetical protein